MLAVVYCSSNCNMREFVLVSCSWDTLRHLVLFLVTVLVVVMVDCWLMDG